MDTTRLAVSRTVPHRGRHSSRDRSIPSRGRRAVQERATERPGSCAAEQPLPAAGPSSTYPAFEPRERPSCFCCRQAPQEHAGFCGPTASHFDAQHHQPCAAVCALQLRTIHKLEHAHHVMPSPAPISWTRQAYHPHCSGTHQKKKKRTTMKAQVPGAVAADCCTANRIH